MKSKVDCVLVGHNELVLRDYEKKLRYMGTNTPTYRDFNLGIIKYKGEQYTAADMLNVLCEGTEFTENGQFRWDDIFSLAIACIATYLDKSNISFDFIAEFQSGKDKLKDIIENCEVLTVGVITTFCTIAEPIIEVVRFIRSLKADVKIIVGGPYVSGEVRSKSDEFISNHFHQIGADYYINSPQGEDTLVKIVECIKECKLIDKIPNIYYKDNDRYIYTFSENENNALEGNVVNWHLFSSQIRSTVSVRTARSCPFSCSYCAFPQHAGKFETASCEHVEKEFKLLNEIEGLNYVNIIDDSFNVPMNRFKDILKMKINNNYDFKWNSFIRCQYLDEESVILMKDSGCEGVFLGIESANQNILDIMEKKADVNQYIRGLELLKKHGIITYASFIFGIPGETKESIYDTINFIRDYQPDFYRIQLWFCDPITPIWKKREEYGLEGTNFSWRHNTMSISEAQSYIEKAFIEINESIWLPQFNFDFTAIFNLLNRGMGLQQIKRYIRVFNEGVRNKLLSGDMLSDNISEKMLNEMKDVFKA